MPSDHLTAGLDSWPVWSATAPTLVGELKGGLTNRSYLLQTDDTRLVLRLNAENASELGLDRTLERQVLMRASRAKVAPGLVYSDPQGGFLITEYHGGRCWESKHSSDADKLLQLAQLLKTTHQLTPVDGILNLYQRAEHYWLTIDKAGAGNSLVVQAIRALRQPLQNFFTRANKLCLQRCLCHNDLLAENLLIGNHGQLLALDWEYAAMGDPYFDLAVVVEGHQMDDAPIQILLEYYSDVPMNTALQRLALLRVIYSYLDLLWHLVQSGAPNLAMTKSKFERLRSLMSA
ncbi:MAG: choline/ethanolamine kinase family protein [Pseudomonadales bacterium]